MNTERSVYKVGRVLRRAWDRPGIASLFAQGTYAHTYRQGIPYENEHAPFFLFTEEQAARAFLQNVQDRFEQTARLAIWQGTATEIWECPSHVYLDYKRERWPSYWRAYQRLRGAGFPDDPANEAQFFSAVALHALASPISAGTVLCPAFRLDECLCLVHGVAGLPA